MHARVDVLSVSPLRDLAPNSVPGMINVLADWEKRCAEVETDIQSRILQVREVARERARARKVEEDMLERALNEGQERKRGPGEEVREMSREKIQGYEGNDGYEAFERARESAVGLDRLSPQGGYER